MDQEEVYFKDLINFGFKRTFMDDELHQDQYGYDDFYVILKIRKNVYAEWDIDSRTIQIYREDKEGMIYCKYPIKNLEHLTQLCLIINPKKFSYLKS